MILLPDGNAISLEIVRTVSYVPGKGVICLSAEAKPVCYIKETNIEIGKRIRDELIKIVTGKSDSPDWSFMKDAA
jgi:hypothetical protein